MSEADAQEGTTTTVEGVVVEKSFELDEFPVPAVKLAVLSERDDAATIRFTDPLPSGVSIDDVGLHPNYGEEALSIEDGAVVFEYELDPSEQFTAVYGLREIDQADLADVPEKPDIEEVTPPLAESSSQVVRDVIEGSTEGEDDEEVETLELRDPNDGTGGTTEAGPSEADPSEAAESEEAESDGEVTEDVDLAIEEAEEETAADVDIGPVQDVSSGVDFTMDAEGVAAALAQELRTGNVDDEVVALLRQELDLGSGSTEARIQRLQSEVADLHAYTEALEDFLDENGTTQQLLTDIRSELDRLDKQVGGNRERLADQVEDVDALDESVTSIEQEVSDLRETVDSYDETFDAVRETTADVESTTEELAADLEDYEAELTELEERYERELDDIEARVHDLEELEDDYEEEFTSLQTRVDEATDDLAGVREEVSRIADEVEDVERVESRLDDLEGTVDEMSSDLEEVAGIQQRLQSVFAGPGDDDGGEE